MRLIIDKCKGRKIMRTEFEKGFTQEAFLAALGFSKDAVFVEIKTVKCNDEPRRIIVTVNREADKI